MFFQPRLNILVFLPILGWKYFCEWIFLDRSFCLRLQLVTFLFSNEFNVWRDITQIKSCRNYHVSIKHTTSAVYVNFWLVLPFRETKNLISFRKHWVPRLLSKVRYSFQKPHDVFEMHVILCYFSVELYFLFFSVSSQIP